MAKTITLENPITAIGRFFARRSILKMQKKIAKLEAKYFNQKASKNTTKQEEKETATEKVSRMSKTKVEEKYGKTIIFKPTSRKTTYYADKGSIDGKFTAWSELTNWLVVSPNPKNKTENRIFFNFCDEKNIKNFTKQAHKDGFEVEFH
jgi:uncharacterized protein YaiL (DUF2058 family)